MFPTLLLLLLSGFNCEASHFMGTVVTYYPKYSDGSLVNVVFRTKTSFHIWSESIPLLCISGTCGLQTSFQTALIDTESSGDWFQREDVSTLQVSSNAPFGLDMTGGAWVDNVNNVYVWQAMTWVETRNRSDTSKANSCPLTTIIPLLRVPSNCQTDFNLLAFDADGDDVRCRYGDMSLSECYSCTPPSNLNISSSCTLSFSPTNSNNSTEGRYVVQLVMEDFPKHNISLTQSNGSQEVKTNNDAISKIPVQFVLSVDPPVPSCTEGLYLPKFLSPTPANGEQLFTPANQSLEISIQAEALNATISALLYSGPSNINYTTIEPGQYILTWTPSQDEAGEKYPICFIVQAVTNSTDKYHSELRCVVVTVGDAIETPPAVSSSHAFLAIRMRISSSILNSVFEYDIYKSIILQQVEYELVRRGVPLEAKLQLSSITTTVNTDGGL